MTSLGALAPGIRTEPITKIGVDHRLLDLVGVGGNGLQAALVEGVEFAQPVDVDVHDGDISTEAQRHGGGVGSRNAGAEDNNLGRADARYTAQEDTLATGRSHQGGSADYDGEAARDLGHRGEQGRVRPSCTVS